MAQTETQEIRPQKSADPKAKKKQENFLLILIAVIIAAGIFILYRNGVIGGSASKAPVEKYLNAICERDFDAFIATMPEKIANDHISDRSSLGVSGEEYMRTLYSDYFDEFGDDMRVTVDFGDRSRPQAVYVDYFKQSYLDLYGEEITVSSVFEIDAVAHFAGSKSSDDIELEFFVIKTGGKWYVVGADYKTEDAE